MIAALAATGLWSVSTLASARGACHLGSISSNLVRLAVALPVLIAGAVLLGTHPWTAYRTGGDWFVWSGLLGMGLCDILMLSAFARIGARATTLTSNACAAPVAALIGWYWLGEHPNGIQTLAMCAILVGVVLVLRPRATDRFDAIGITCALASAVTFACSGVMSRIGFAQAVAAGDPIHWLDSAVLRVTAGLALCLVAFVLAAPFHRVWRDGPGRWRQAVPWLSLNACLGPGAGLVCYQWALTTTPAAEVHAIIAAVPVLVMAATWMMGEERPDFITLLGTTIAVAGVVALTLMSG